MDKIHDLAPRFIKKFLRRMSVKTGVTEKLVDQYYTNLAIEKINELYDQNLQPFFMLIHYWSVHIPYEPPRKYLEEFKIYDYKEKTIILNE